MAAEMRRLAERVTALVGDVGSFVTDIDQASAEAVEATTASLHLGEASVETAERVSLEINGHSSETSAAAEGMLEIAEMIEATARAITQTRSAASGLQTHAYELERLLAKFSVRELSAASEGSGSGDKAR